MRAACAGARPPDGGAGAAKAAQRSAQRMKSSGWIACRRRPAECCPILGSAQIGRTFKKKRPSQPIPCASACGAAAAVLDAHVGDLRRGDDVAGLDRARVDLAREAQHVDVVVDADLLLAGDQQVAVRQHAGHVAVIVPEKSLLFSVLPLPAKVLLEVADGAWRGRTNWRESSGSAVMPAASLPLLSIELVLFCVARDLLDDLHRERVADQARAVVLEQRPVLRRPGRSRRC